MKRPPHLLLAARLLGLLLVHGIAHNIIRTAKVTFLVDVAGAEAIPLVEAFGLLPATIAAAWVVSRLLDRWSLASVFTLVTTLLVGTFAALSFALFPYRHLPAVYSLFWICGDLWKATLLAVLIRTLINTRLSAEMAKQVYPALGLSVGLSSSTAGLLTVALNSTALFDRYPLASDRWLHSLRWMMLVVVLLAAVMCVAFSYLTRVLPGSNVGLRSGSLRSCAREVTRTPILRLLLAMVLCDYFAYYATELVFLDYLKGAVPEPHAYCCFLARLTAWGGGANVACALLIAPWMLGRLPWVVPALVTPVVMLLGALPFFTARISGHQSLALTFGSVLYCFCRVAKYSLFDPTRELVYVWLPQLTQIRGKLVIDSIGSRLGRGVASGIEMALVAAFGTIGGAVPCIGLLVGTAGAFWIRAVYNIGGDRKIMKDVANSRSRS